MTDNHTGIDTSVVVAELRERSTELQATQWQSTCGAVECGISAVLCDRAADMIQALSTELTAAREALAWRPLDSAPHETLVVLGWDENGVWKQEIGLASAGWCNSLGYSNRWLHGSATHWQPLPPGPPAAMKDGGTALLEAQREHDAGRQE